MNRILKDGSIRLTVTLPRVRVYGGRVGHIMIDGSNISSLQRSARSTGFIRSTACHTGDDEYLGEGVELASPGLPTCRACLKAMETFEVEIVQ